MQLVLGAVLVFVGVGLASRRLDWRQQVLIILVAVSLATIQLTAPRFL